MTFLEQIFASLERNGDAVVLQEMRESGAVVLQLPGSCSLKCRWLGLSAALEVEKGRPLRASGPQFGAMGRDGSGHHGGRPDRRPALCAAGAGRTGRDDERLLAGGDCVRRSIARGCDS